MTKAKRKRILKAIEAALPDSDVPTRYALHGSRVEGGDIAATDGAMMLVASADVPWHEGPDCIRELRDGQLGGEIDGLYPKWRDVIPPPSRRSVRTDVAAAHDALKDAHKHGARWSEEEFVIIGKPLGFARANGCVKPSIDGLYRASYLRDGFALMAAAGATRCDLRFPDAERKPLVIEGEGDGVRVLAIIMPIGPRP